MQIEKRMKNHYRRWNINLNYEEEFLKFKHRLIGVINRLIGDYLTENSDVDKHFFEIFNLDKADKPDVKKAEPRYKNPLIESIKSLPISYTDKGFGDTYVYKCIDSCKTLQDLGTSIYFLGTRRKL
jgi:hypothetical protein